MRAWNLRKAAFAGGCLISQEPEVVNLAASLEILQERPHPDQLTLGGKAILE